VIRAVIRTFAFPFFTAIGIELGGPLVGAVPAMFFCGRPFKTAIELAEDLKIWAMAMAIGGSFTVLEALETGLVHRQINQVVKQGTAVIGAFAGAQVGFWIIKSLTRAN
jgi:hypothetical protein